MSRPTLCIARPPKPAPVEVLRLEHESDWHFAARCASIERLGAAWWRHPQYAHPARHSRNAEVWTQARAPYLAEIARAAAADRARNPLAVMQQQINQAMKGEGK
jgi:hypothetical protein